MNTSIDLKASLSAQVDSLNAIQPSDAQVTEAQIALEAALNERSVRKPPRAAIGWLAAAGAGAAAVVAMFLLPLSGESVAFAEVVKHFKGFDTLAFDMDTRLGDQSIQQSRVYVNKAGDVRTDVGEDLSVIVSLSEGQVLTLAHGPRVAIRTPIDAAPANEDDPLSWLEELREYQRQASPLGTKVIGSETLRGWELKLQGMRTELWADENGLPARMLFEQDGMEIHMLFSFDKPLAEELFSVETPAGYEHETGADESPATDERA